MGKEEGINSWKEFLKSLKKENKAISGKGRKEKERIPVTSVKRQFSFWNFVHLNRNN